MAQMVPAEVASFTTPGEALVYNFFKCAARPDATHICWYAPNIDNREPDFILYSPECGLIVIEVKDWVIDQIIEMDPKSAKLRIGKTEEIREQPLAQARNYVNHLLSLLGRAQSRDAPRCPVTWGAALPHISRAAWSEAGLAAVADPNKIFFWDELNEFSPLLQDVSGASFRHWMQEHFPPLFPFSLTGPALNRLRQIIFPIVRIQLPPRGQCAMDQSASVAALDSAQENAAKNLGAGSLLINGPAGSGKTLVLSARAAWLAATGRNIKKILLTCFNLSLAGYIRRLVAAHSKPGDQSGIEVLPFYMLCERIIGERLEHASEGADYYSMVVDECLERLSAGHELKGYWDAILVDEGQDFSSQMAQVILRLLPAGGSLSVAQDDAQQLYQANAASWETANGLMQCVFRRQYRNTGQISKFAADYLGIAQPDTVAPSGKRPVLVEFADMEAQIQGMADSIAQLVASGVAMGEIAALYFSSRFEKNRSFPEELIRALESRGVMARWLSRDATSKRFYDISTDSVTISTIHSVKGMDFGHVFLAGFAESSAGNFRRLAYVGMTRAREQLVLCKLAGQGGS